jgi:hypothetical protein
VQIRPGVFDDIPNPQISLRGVYAVHLFKLLPDGHADICDLGYQNTKATYDKVALALSTGNELRNSLGTRVWGQPLPWEYDVEALWQFGQFGRGNIEAGAIISAIRYNFNELPLRPRVGLVSDITSGDRNPRSRNLQTFNPMFPTGAYLNLANPVGPAKFMQVHPNMDVRFGESLTARVDWAFVWRESVADGIYGPVIGPPIRTAQSSRGWFVGSSPAATVTWNATRHVTVMASYVHFLAGPFLKETPPRKDLDYFTFLFGCTFYSASRTHLKRLCSFFFVFQLLFLVTGQIIEICGSGLSCLVESRFSLGPVGFRRHLGSWYAGLFQFSTNGLDRLSPTREYDLAIVPIAAFLLKVRCNPSMKRVIISFLMENSIADPEPTENEFRLLS